MKSNKCIGIVSSLAGLTLLASFSLGHAESDGTTGASREKAPQADAVKESAKSPALKALPEHPMTALETSHDLVIEAIPQAPMGQKLDSEFRNRPDVKLAPDPERESVERGRREAKPIDSEFEIASNSIEELVGQILAALRSDDRHVMKALQITEPEFTSILWPEFPESRPGPGVPPGEAFFFLDRACNSGISTGMSGWGGQDLKAVRVRFDVGVQRFTNFNLYEGFRIFAVPAAGGPETELGFVRTIVERNGRWKVYGFKDMD